MYAIMQNLLYLGPGRQALLGTERPRKVLGRSYFESAAERDQPLVTFHHGMISATGITPLMVVRIAAGWTHWP